MSTPIDELSNPFGDASIMSGSPYESSRDGTGASSGATGTTPEDILRERPKEKKRVGFTGGGASTSSPPVATPAGSESNTPGHGRQSSAELLSSPVTPDTRSHLPQLSAHDTEEIKRAFSINIAASAPRPAIRQTVTGPAALTDHSEDELDGQTDGKAYRRRRAREAFERGKELERDERIRSEPNSRYNSPERRIQRRAQPPSIKLDDVPLQDLDLNQLNHRTDSGDTSPIAPTEGVAAQADTYAQDLVEKHKASASVFHESLSASGLRSGAVTPTEEHHFFEEYKPQPDKYRGGILGALLKLYDGQSHPPASHALPSNVHNSLYPGGLSADTSNNPSTDVTPQHSPPDSGATTPRGGRNSWYSLSRNPSSNSLAQLVGSSASLGSPAVLTLGEQVNLRLKEQKEQQKRPGLGQRVRSSGTLNAINKHIKARTVNEIRIKNHISEIIARQRYLVRLCKALMMYGAPTHRLEEYMTMSSRVLEMEAQFLYIPGAMIMSFNDPATHTTEVKLVKVPQGLDLGKLRDVHEIYKEVVHDRVGVEDAMTRLQEVMSKKPKHNKWVLIPVYGLASACVGPFAFGAQLIDLPIAFLLGCILGVLQLVVAPASDLYANVFEITASVVTSFLARMFGSINGGNTFCFAALAQSSIALILPGYTVLCASLELQSRSLVAGSVRMVYAIIYSLFLGFGITIGTAIYGLIDHNATSNSTCSNSVPAYWFFFFVPGFTLCLIVINQAKWKQAPVMMIIAFVGYIVNYFSSQRFVGNTQVSNTLGALAIGVMANAYSRVGSRVENFALDMWENHLRRHWKRFRRVVFKVHGSGKKTPKKLEEGGCSSGASSVSGDNESTFVPKVRRVGYSLAAAAMLPAIFVQVPSGLAVNGSLISGIASANQITGNATNGTQVTNLTSLSTAEVGLNTVAYNVGYSVIQVAIGITVGLFLSAIVVYPFGKKRSGLFSF